MSLSLFRVTPMQYYSSCTIIFFSIVTDGFGFTFLTNSQSHFMPIITSPKLWITNGKESILIGWHWFLVHMNLQPKFLNVKWCAMI